MKNKCQNLIEIQHNELLKLLQNFKQLFSGTLVTWKTDPVEFEFKQYLKPMSSRPYPVSKVNE